MPDAVKVGFVPFSAAARGILVVFCDDTLKFGTATAKAMGAVTGIVKRAAATNQFKGKAAPRSIFWRRRASRSRA